MISYFVPQNQADFNLSVAPQNQRSEVSVEHALRSSDEASLARVFQFCLKTGGGAMTGGARGIIADVVSSEN
jgi:hypothetical protein